MFWIDVLVRDGLSSFPADCDLDHRLHFRPRLRQGWRHETCEVGIQYHSVRVRQRADVTLLLHSRLLPHDAQTQWRSHCPETTAEQRMDYATCLYRAKVDAEELRESSYHGVGFSGLGCSHRRSLCSQLHPSNCRCRALHGREKQSDFDSFLSRLLQFGRQCSSHLRGCAQGRVPCPQPRSPDPLASSFPVTQNLDQLLRHSSQLGCVRLGNRYYSGSRTQMTTTAWPQEVPKILLRTSSTVQRQPPPRPRVL